LYPLYVPYKVQHVVLTRTQSLLEECCYDFTAQWLPELLEQRRWDCPEAIELNKWTYIVVKRLDKLPYHRSQAFANDNAISLTNTIISINKLRHSAVHRLPTTAKGILEMIRSATGFARTLRDSTREQQLNELHTELESKIRALELNKNFLETKVEEEMEQIAKQRRELDEREKEAVVTMLREDKDQGSLIGALLSQSVKQIFDKSENKKPEATGAELNSDQEIEQEEGHEPAIGHKTTHPVKPDLLLEVDPGSTHDTVLEKREPQPTYQFHAKAG